MSPKKASRMESVELQRLQALADTQRKHIEELNSQLHELLEVQKQQQLQLVEQSPARRNVRQLLAKAAADNTALAKRVEELRAQRNALAVTKAALTAQMSELIQAAADDAQREVQHTHLLAQVQQLYQLIGQQGASQPTAQLAAVLAYVERASLKQQRLQGPLAYCKAGTAQHPHATDSCLSLSPTDQQLDSKATSQLIWWDGSCTEGSMTAEDTLDNTPTATAAATSKCFGDAGYRVGCSGLSDMSYISPLRGSSIPGGTSHSRTPTTAQAQYGDALGSPLSCQSLSQLSSSKGTFGGDLAPKRLDLEATPVSKCRGLEVGDVCSCSSSKPATYLTSAGGARTFDQSPSRDQCGSSSHGVALTFSECPMLLMSPVFDLQPKDLEQQSLAPRPRHGSKNSAAVRDHNARTPAGLQLGAGFRLAACESVWPSPALADSDCNSSSMLSCAAWLARQQPDSPDTSRVLAFSHALLDGCEQTEEEQRCQHSSRRHKALVMGLLLAVPLAAVAFAGGAAAWRLKQREVLEMVAMLKKRVQVTVQPIMVGAAGGWRNLLQGLCATWDKIKPLSRSVQHCKAGSSSNTSAHVTGAFVSEGVEEEA